MPLLIAIAAILAYTAAGVVFARIVEVVIGPPPSVRRDEHEVFLAFAGILWPIVLTVAATDFVIRLVGNVLRGR